MSAQRFRGIISSDWNQCLAPCGPFDPIIYSYPDLGSELTGIFTDYTGNRISLGTANERIRRLLPEGLSMAQMDSYLDETFTTYPGVPDLIDWCRTHQILFMINTTGYLGYFQRIFAKHLLPKVPVISANTMIRYPSHPTDPGGIYELAEIGDKAANTALALKANGISSKKMVIIGDSGGDGPHFHWGRRHDAFLIASMAKPSLVNYCQREKIQIDLFFGPTCVAGEKRCAENAMSFDFMELIPALETATVGVSF